MPALSSFPTGASVTKPSALPVDYAFGRIGIVLREVADGKEHVGVLWEDAYTIVEYPADEEFEPAR